MSKWRLIPPKAALHIMCRGNNKQEILRSDRDKFKYYSLLAEHKDENKITIFHYCIMHNHVHLIVWIEEASTISKFMKQVNLGYFAYYKNIYGYCGHLWQGRFKSKLIERDSYLLQCGKYIELNPVRKGIAHSPEEYTFSSYNHYAHNKHDLVVTESPMYLAMNESAKNRRRQYIDFIVPVKIGEKRSTRGNASGG
jgi:putative transposase